MTTETTDQQTKATFDLDAAINERVADHSFDQAQKQQQADAERQEKVAKRRAHCEESLAKAFPAELRASLGMEVDEHSVVSSNGYPVSGYPAAVFALDDHLWQITLEYGNGIWIVAPDGKDEQTRSNDENVDELLLQIGLWREREAERKRRERRERDEEAEKRRITAAADEDEPIPLQEPTPPRMIGDPDDTTVAFILSESLSYYSTAVVQMQAKFTGSEIYLISQDGMHKPRQLSLTEKQFEALMTARDLYRAHLAAIKERREQRANEDPDEVPF